MNALVRKTDVKSGGVSKRPVSGPTQDDLRVVEVALAGIAVQGARHPQNQQQRAGTGAIWTARRRILRTSTAPPMGWSSVLGRHTEAMETAHGASWPLTQAGLSECVRLFACMLSEVPKTLSWRMPLPGIPDLAKSIYVLKPTA